MPQWLKDLTGRKFWPDETPPYIDMSIDFSDVPVVNMRLYGDCALPPGTCAFECNQCFRPGDIVSCKSLSQSFDDGPTSQTVHLLDHLESTGQKATFFIPGTSAVKFPHLVRREYDQGHVVGLHTWSHPFLPSLSNEAIAAQMQWSIWAINATIGKVPKYFRPPFAGMDDRVRAIVKKFNVDLVLWDRDTFDWRLNLADSGETNELSVLESIEMWRNQNGGGLILQHDSSSKLVKLSIKASKLIGPKGQLTVDKCYKGGRPYQ
ncbi:carbohydrate esterase family 4 protein [Tortispora caseinolytica NRRL Y-17796]|uniref:chitin deacetylase n=1 Tax=Tortispora caseinolytica NRRL Y-17796 TaxID=767744 RepID=A0A1E4TG39_9ASCO|nr:carbohydrate esterase family 4 protein [Tortispora caseinolytica NRRL Y-17796]